MNAGRNGAGDTSQEGVELSGMESKDGRGRPVASGPFYFFIFSCVGPQGGRDRKVVEGFQEGADGPVAD
jgi:hypothetical protein